MVFLNWYCLSVSNHCYSVVGLKQWLARHFRTQLQLAVFNLKRTVVPLHQFSKFKRILFEKSTIFHDPHVGFRKTVKFLRKSLLKTAFILKSWFYLYFQVQKNSLKTFQISFVLRLNCRYIIIILQKAARGLFSFGFL